MNIYWYKDDLKRFLMGNINDPYILSNLNWDDYKRNIVKKLLDILTRNQEKYQREIIDLMFSVCDFTDFSHLRNLEDGIDKEKKANSAVSALKKYVVTFKEIIREESELEKRKASYESRIVQKQGIQDRLKKLKDLFNELALSKDKQKRGFILQDILRDLFDIFDLDPKASFAIAAEQIDGSFTFDSNDFIVEARWREEPADRASLDEFNMKVARKLDNTLGLFISINGFNKSALDIYEQTRSMMILMDGMDLIAVLEERIDLKELLLRKRRHASQTGKIFISVNEILKN